MLCVVGDRHADKVRDVTGYVDGYLGLNNSATRGVFKVSNNAAGNQYTGTAYHGLTFDASRVVPTGSYSTPRAFGCSACVYLGS